jgi:type I restriction enzyme, S subunit
MSRSRAAPWEICELGEYAEFRNGVNFSAKDVGPDLPIINVGDFGSRSVPDYHSLREIDQGVVTSEDAILQDGDVIAVRSNGNRELIGRTMFIRQPPRVTHSAFTIRIRVHERGRSRLLPAFLAYALRGPTLRATLAAHGHGTNISNLNQGILSRLTLPLPPLLVQHEIVSILSAYDDLIENNDRRIRILEEMAHRIYREWFVDFRYPDREDVLLVDSEMGPIPEGWEWLSASAALTLNPKIAIDGDATHPFVPMTSVSESGMHIAPVEQRTGASGARFENGDTLFARITPSLENGKTAYVQCLSDGEVATGSTEFIVFRARRLCPELTYLLARDERLRGHAVQSMAGASGRQRVRAECFDTFMLAVPPTGLVDRFARLVRPMFTLSRELFVAAGNLRSTRDLLLPRLLSGQVDVTDLDIAAAAPSA